MTFKDWMIENLPKKATLSIDAVEILLKLAWDAAAKNEKQIMSKNGWKPPTEIKGPYEIE